MAGPSEIRELYRDPEKGLIGVKAFAEKNHLPLHEVQTALRGEDVYTKNAPAINKYERRRIMVNHADQQWQADLMDMNGQIDANQGFRYILCVIDCFTKYAWARPLKNKNAADVAKGLQSILEQGRAPKMLQTDNGTEFYNKTVNALLQKYDIRHFSTDSPVKAAIVERFNRTLRLRLTKLWDVQATFNWTDQLQTLINSYNHTKHSSIGMTPAEASLPQNKDKVFDNLYPPTIIVPNPPDLEVGQHVRISMARGPFTKEQVNKWSDEIFVIDRILHTVPVTYKLKDLAGEELTGPFYRNELQPVDKPEKFGVEILKKRTYRGKKQVFVHWIGYPKSMDEWISND